MCEIVPTILTSDLEEFFRKIDLVRGVVGRVQVDIVDGKFAPKKTIALEIIKDLENIEKLGLDLHLMVDKPEEWVNRALEVLPDRVVAQVEMMNDPKDFISQVVEGGVATGIALDLDTTVESIDEEIYRLSDLVLIMSVKAGEGGQSFDPRTIGKIEKVKKILGDLGEIGVDGGLDEKSIKLCKQAGANIFYVGKTFWEAEDLGKRYNELLGLISKS